MSNSLKQFIFSLLIAICLNISGYAHYATPSKDLPNLYKVNSNLYRGGQPTEEGLQQLKKLGIKTIIDLRNDDERAKREESWVKADGLRFINIPLSNIFGPKDAKIDAILNEIARSENQPVFIHCKRGADRTGTVIAVYRITHDGWTGKQANEEAKKFGFGWWQFWMKDYINDYYRDFKAKTSKPQEPSMLK